MTLFVFSKGPTRPPGDGIFHRKIPPPHRSAVFSLKLIDVSMPCGYRSFLNLHPWMVRLEPINNINYQIMLCSLTRVLPQSNLSCLLESYFDRPDGLGSLLRALLRQRVRVCRYESFDSVRQGASLQGELRLRDDSACRMETRQVPRASVSKVRRRNILGDLNTTDTDGLPGASSSQANAFDCDTAMISNGISTVTIGYCDERL